MTRFNSTERIGVAAVENIFLQFNWIPRTVFQTDVGIDMTVEICNEGKPTGKFLGIQIKTGASYFQEKSRNSVVFRSDKVHIDYWINNSLPILIVLHDIDTNLTIWQAVNKQTIELTGKSFKIQIPLSNTLNKKFASKIEKLTEKSPLLNNFQKLLLEKPIIDFLFHGEKIVVELDMWINKSSGKADIKIYHVISDNEIKEEEKNDFWEIDENDESLVQVLLEEYSATGVKSFQSLYYFYKWADFKVDETFYESFSDYDDENTPGYKIVFLEDSFRNYQLPIIPYHNDGEIAHYRLKMSLNEYGHSIIDFFSYLRGEKQLELKFD